MELGKDSALRLLLVDDSVEAAEAIVSGLRNSGIAVRPSRPENDEELVALLNDRTFELVLAAHGARIVPVERVMQLVASSGKDLPSSVRASTS